MTANPREQSQKSPTRRAVSAGLAGLASTFVLSLSAHASAKAEGTAYISAARDGAGRFIACGLSESGETTFRVPLPGRGHGAAVRPDRAEAVVFARRPDAFALSLNLTPGFSSSRSRAAFAAPPNRHFYGHGAYSPDGRLLYASENDFDAARGVIGIYDAARGYTRLAEFSSYGVGPHQLLLMPDGKTLAVANGGIATHPDYPRAKLNLPDMRPSLALIDRQSGALLHQHCLPPEWHQLSIRHLSVSTDGTLAIAMQYEGPSHDLVPLAAILRPGAKGLEPLFASDGAWSEMRQYTGSAAFSRDGETLAISAPRGGVVALFDVQTGRHLVSLPAADTSGIAALGTARDGFLAASGSGAIATLRAGAFAEPNPTPDLAPDRASDLAFDNHLTATSGPFQSETSRRPD